MRIVAILVTYRRREWMKRCLLSLEAAARATPSIDLSIRVGVNGPDPESEEALESLRRRPRRALIESRGFAQRRTPAAVRNQLLADPENTPDWYFFVDDDAYVEPDHFRRFLTAVGKRPGPTVVGGPNLTPACSARFQRAAGLAMACRLASGISVSRYVPRGALRGCGEESLILCNLFVRASALGAKPFHEIFFCNEENWLLQDLRRQGATLIYDPALFIWHERRRTIVELAVQTFRYGSGRGLNLRLRPRTARPAHVIPSLCFVFAAYALVQWTLQTKVNELFVGCGAAYLLLCGVAAWGGGHREKEKPSVIFVASLCFPTIHLAYGIGVIVGILKRHPSASV